MSNQYIKDSKNNFELTPDFELALDALENTSNNLFITGKAGTGKSSLIHKFRNQTKKKVAVLAPTGLAAINIQGQTIHSFFKFPPRMITPEVLNGIRTRSILYKQLDTIIIDEASMIRADVLDGIDQFLRRRGKFPSEPFGGIQIVLVGDLFQLPPVVRHDEGQILANWYETPYFFSARSFMVGSFQKIRLGKVFRQLDDNFLDILNQIRSGNVSQDALSALNTQQGIDETNNQAITLTTINRIATNINLSRLAQLPKPEFKANAKVEGNFNSREGSLPVDMELKLRPGARVMFVKNGDKWVNGSLGEVITFTNEAVIVRLDETGEEVDVTTETWENVRYKYKTNSNEVDVAVVGTLRQFPLRLAWAITIHKSQGMTFDNVNLDFSRAAFAHGQTYVALSRCRTLEGLSIRQPLDPKNVILDQRIVDFLSTF